MGAAPALYLGSTRRIEGAGTSEQLLVPAHHLVTHGVVVGMTGSGKTGLLTVLVEEALRARVPTLLVDVKGDLPNLLLAPPLGDAAAVAPWLEAPPPGDDRPQDERARDAATARDASLASWGLGAADVEAYRATTRVRVITPGSTAGEPLHVLSSLERRSPLWDSDPESARAALSAAVSLVLRLLGRDPDPASSREHVLLAVLAERRLRAGASADLASLLADVERPPIDMLGALPVDTFLPRSERRELAVALDTLLASPTFETWRQGATLDVGAWLSPGDDGRTPAVIVSVAHLDDDERALVLGVLLQETLAWVRTQPGSQALRALVVFDEVVGFLPPHPANPPTKRPLVALMKQARAFGVGVVVATQNPMDLDYRALGNAGVWCVGRLQTDADRARVVDGLTAGGADRAATRRLAQTIGRLSPRWFVLRDAHAGEEPVLMQPRSAISLLRGPMTRRELRRARGQ